MSIESYAFNTSSPRWSKLARRHHDRVADGRIREVGLNGIIINSVFMNMPGYGSYTSYRTPNGFQNLLRNIRNLQLPFLPDLIGWTNADAYDQAPVRKAGEVWIELGGPLHVLLAAKPDNGLGNPPDLVSKGVE